MFVRTLVVGALLGRKVWGARIDGPTQFNHWWLRTDLDRVNPGKNGHGAYVSAYYLARWATTRPRT
jgi:hypothetical protein